MKPLYKWTGGKRKEIKTFRDFYPNFMKNNEKYKFVEPFFGGGAVFWDLENDNNVINDIDYDLINFMKTISTDSEKLIDMCLVMCKNIDEITLQEKTSLITSKEAKEKRGEFYYNWRNKDRNNGLEILSNLDRAFRFYFVNQMSFNGMRRFNSKGEFNIPYGNYKNFNNHFEPRHIEILKNTKISNCSYKEVMENNDDDNTFIFIDPPYTREFSEYSHGSFFGNKEQIELFNTFKDLKNAKAMIIINKDDFTSNLYKDYIKDEYNLKYSTNIKNRFDQEVKHLIITNY
jgi:DNA adenine methylase